MVRQRVDTGRMYLEENRNFRILLFTAVIYNFFLLVKILQVTI